MVSCFFLSICFPFTSNRPGKTDQSKLVFADADLKFRVSEQKHVCTICESVKIVLMTNQQLTAVT